MTATLTETFTLEDFLANPPDHQEWVNGQLVETTGMTVKHSRIQSKLDRFWGNYAIDSGQGGETLVEVPCRTLRQGRRFCAVISGDYLRIFSYD